MSRPTMTRHGWYAAATAALLATAGCSGSISPSGVEVAIRRPPPRRVEVRTTTPGPGYVWIDGHYAWQGGDYVWVGGRWESPPSPRQHWHAGRWVHARGGWYWQEGHWG
ncbi:MAG TPA: hypothetical protein VGL65_13645 [Gemmatimonadales bacterium]